MIGKIPHSNTIEDVICTIEVMRHQEETTYKCNDYLAMHQSDPPSNKSHKPQQAPADADCRFKMTEWCYQVIDFCKFNRETVEIAMSIFDRFLATPQGKKNLHSRKKFQLCAMTCLYTAIKVFEPEAMEPVIISNLSRGVYTVEHVESMEREILVSIGFQINVPTSIAFAHHFLGLLPKESMSDTEQSSVMEVIALQVEHAVSHYEFIEVRASEIALASLSNAFECLEFNKAMKDDYLRIVSNMVSVDMECTEYGIVTEKLLGVLVKSPLGRKAAHAATEQCHLTSKTKTSEGSVCSSPRSVVQYS